MCVHVPSADEPDSLVLNTGDSSRRRVVED